MLFIVELVVYGDNLSYFIETYDADFYNAHDESRIIRDDSDIGIGWPIGGINELIFSEKDKKWQIFVESIIKY